MSMNIEHLSNAGLHQFLFGVHDNQNFIQATAEYMADLSETQSKQITNLSQILTYESQAQGALVDITKKQTEEVNQAYQEQAEMQTSGLPDWVSKYLMPAFNFLLSALTLDPVMIGISGFSMSMQMSGLQQKLIQAVCGDNAGKAAAFEFGLSMGEALVGGLGSAAKATTVVEEEVEEEAMQTGGLASETFSGRLTSSANLKNVLSYLGQTLMQNNFWMDFFRGPCKMSDTAAMALGMVMGMGFTLGTSACAEENGLAQAFKGRLQARWGDSFEKLLSKMNLGLNLITSGLEVTSSAIAIQNGQVQEELADFTRSVMGPNASKLALYQSLLGEWTPTISLTQETMSQLASSAADQSRTFNSLAEMFRIAQ